MLALKPNEPRYVCGCAPAQQFLLLQEYLKARHSCRYQEIVARKEKITTENREGEEEEFTEKLDA